MWPATFVLAIAVLWLGQDKPGKPPVPPAAGTTGGQTENGTKDGWQAFRATLKKRLAADLAQLKTKLAPYLPDLGLEYEENRQYLEVKIAKLALLDPDLGGLLVDVLEPRRPGARSQRIAENAAEERLQKQAQRHLIHRNHFNHAIPNGVGENGRAHCQKQDRPPGS